MTFNGHVCWEDQIIFSWSSSCGLLLSSSRVDSVHLEEAFVNHRIFAVDVGIWHTIDSIADSPASLESVGAWFPAVRGADHLSSSLPVGVDNFVRPVKNEILALAANRQFPLVAASNSVVDTENEIVALNASPVRNGVRSTSFRSNIRKLTSPMLVAHAGSGAAVQDEGDD